MNIPLDREIKILWNGITRTTVQSVNGEFEGSFKLPYDTMVGNHFLIAKVEDQNYLRESSDSVEVFVQRETEIVIQWLGGYRNQSSTISGYLRDAAGVGLPDLELDFYFDGNYVGNTSGSSGKTNGQNGLAANCVLGQGECYILSAVSTASEPELV